MRLNSHGLWRLTVISLCIAIGLMGGVQTTCAQNDVLKGARVAATMVLIAAPTNGTDFALTFWEKAEPVRTTLTNDAIVQGTCIHCNRPMKFQAGKASTACNVCPCGASFAACLTGKGTKKTSWRDMLDDLPPGTGLRGEFINPDKPAEGVKLLTVDLRSVLLPLHEPLRLSDSEILAMVKSFGVQSEERSGGDRLLRLALKSDWTTDKELKMAKTLAEHGIIIDFGVRD